MSEFGAYPNAETRLLDQDDILAGVTDDMRELAPAFTTAFEALAQPDPIDYSVYMATMTTTVLPSGGHVKDYDS